MAGIYIHIPYCHSKCGYCDFYSMPVCKDPDTLVECLCQEYRLRRNEVTEEIKTIYIGGGTPSILPDSCIAKLIDCIGTNGLEELTIEVNPEDVSAERAKLWASMGITRVSMGIQSMNDSELRLIGRRHDSKRCIDAVSEIRAGGINNISLDVIYGLPSQTVESWRQTLTSVLDLEPNHLSAYLLSYEPRTRLTAMRDTGKIQPATEDDIVEMYEMLCQEARLRGYNHYEISNFAKDGFMAIHNSSYWDGTPYIGLGPAAHSYDGRTRRINPPNIKLYTEKLSAGTIAYVIDEETRTDKFNDMLITALRTARGLNFKRVPVTRRLPLLSDAYPYIKSGQIVVDDNNLIVPEKYWLVSDNIMRDLLQEETKHKDKAN